MMNRTVFSGIVAVVLGAIACGGAVNGEPGASGMNGANGANGADGSNGTNGSNGLPGDQGEVGSTGDAGHVGDMICGNTLITAEDWHSVCGSSVGACHKGQVQCRGRLSEVTSGELILERVCFGSQPPVSVPEGKGLCNEDVNCDGVLDNTSGQGDNVNFVKQAMQSECMVSGSSVSHDVTLKEGRCRNAKKHCLLPDNPDTCKMDANGEGVLWAEFVSATHEADMGFECVGADSTIRTWECVIDKVSNVASVTCTGPRGL